MMLNVSALLVDARSVEFPPPTRTSPTSSPTSDRNAATLVLGVIAGTIFSRISLLVVPPSVEMKKRTTPAVVVPVACTTTRLTRLPTPAAAAVDGPVATVTIVPVPSRLVFAVVTCATSMIGCAVNCAVVASR